MIAATILIACCLPQDVPPPATASPRLGVRVDERGWPVVAEPAPGPESKPGGGREPEAPAQPVRVESPLPGVFRAVGSPEAFAALGRVTAKWRLTVHGPGGEPTGLRTVVHAADLAHGARDRLEFEDGRVYRRVDAQVAAERHGMPWPTLVESAGHELQFFGLQLRLPWAFAEERAFAVVGCEAAAGDGERLVRLSLQRRLDRRQIGPDPEPVAVDRFTLSCPATGGPPVELTQQLAATGVQRQVRLEDWRDVRGVKLPFRRVYVDATGRPATTLELLEFEPGRAEAGGDQGFR